MKVFACKREGGYSGGLILAAASTKEEAYQAYLADKRFDWMHEYNYETEEYERDYYYPFESWFECEDLTAVDGQPRVLYECGYSE